MPSVQNLPFAALAVNISGCLIVSYFWVSDYFALAVNISGCLTIVSGTGEIEFGGTYPYYPHDRMEVCGGGTAATLTLGPGITVRGSRNGVIEGCYAEDTLLNQGTLRADAAGKEVTVSTANWTNGGLLEAHKGGSLSLNGTLRIDGMGAFVSRLPGKIWVNGNLLGNSQNASWYLPQDEVRLGGSGNSTSPQLLEVMSQDLSAAGAGLSDNFAYARLSLTNRTYVRLVDQSDNAVGADAEALYVGTLSVASGATLDLNGLHVYVRALDAAGTIVGGQVTLISDGGPIASGMPTPGSVAIQGEVDPWTFTGATGETVSVALNPGNSGGSNPPAAFPPHLAYAQVQLIAPDGTVLATGSSSSSGEVVFLPEIELFANGLYRVEVRAAPSQGSSTGNYLLTVTEGKYPYVKAHVPTGRIAGPVDSVVFSFNQTIDQSSFSPADDVVQFTGPRGQLVPTGLVWDSPRELRVTFDSQSDLGHYRLVIGPAIENLLHNPMDQDGNLFSGEVPADRYAADYRIEFWNDPSAEVAAQDSIMDDTLDPNLFDLSTFEFTRVGFLRWDVPLSGGQAIDTRVDMRPDVNLVVDITGTFDPDTGKILWWFRCSDPGTGEYPEDPKAGFLPPFNTETAYELGWMEFSVKPRAGLPTGTRIENRAYGEFDLMGDRYNHPAPPRGPWLNTIDAGSPTSQVLPLPPTSFAPLVVHWDGQDDEGGSGIRTYDVYVSTDDGAFLPFLLDTTLTSARFDGQPNHTYAFYSVATDNVGHREAIPAVADTQATVVSPLLVWAWPAIV